MIARHKPDFITVNAGGARFLEAEPNSMTAVDVANAAKAAPRATVVAMQFEVINHCPPRRTEL